MANEALSALRRYWLFATRHSPLAHDDEVELIQSIVIARSEATKQSRTAAPHWIASLGSQ
jgi:hypothetical protein